MARAAPGLVTATGGPLAGPAARVVPRPVVLRTPGALEAAPVTAVVTRMGVVAPVAARPALASGGRSPGTRATTAARAMAGARPARAAGPAGRGPGTSR
jgi:hypothetical protein